MNTKQKLFTFTSIGAVFATAIAFVAITGARNLEQLKAGNEKQLQQIVFNSSSVKNEEYDGSMYYYFDLIGETPVSHSEFRSAEEYCYVLISTGSEDDVSFKTGGNILSATNHSKTYGGLVVYIYFYFDDTYADFQRAYAMTSASESAIDLTPDSTGYTFSYSIPGNTSFTLNSITFEYYCK